jgi:membrane-associated phospholipid phosphatase
VFAIPYLFYLPWLWVVIFYSWLKNKSFHKLAYSVIIIEAIAYCVYLTFQTYIPREPIISNDIFSWVLRFIYNYDQPYNALPSLHAALSTSIASYFICRKSRWSLVSVSIAIVIIASTLLVKQHFVMDAVSGIILGAVVTLVVFKVLSCKDKSRKD